MAKPFHDGDEQVFERSLVGVEATHLSAGGGGHFEHLARHIVTVVCDAHDPPLPSDAQASVEHASLHGVGRPPHVHFVFAVDGLQVLDLALCNEPSLVQEHNAFADLLDVVHQVRGHQHAPLAVSHRRVQGLEHEITRRSVETVGRLIRDDHLRVVNDGAREFGGLPHAR